MSPLQRLEQWRVTGRSFNHQGHHIFYRVEGAVEGNVLVFIHGFPTASWDWHRLWEPLRARFSGLIAADMLGFGFSDKPRPHRYTIAAQADLQEALLQALGVRRYHILAHDYGDTVAQELLARQLERRPGSAPHIDSCALLNGGLFPEVHRARPVQKLLASPLGPLLARFMREGAFHRSFAAIFGSQAQPTREELQAFWRLLSQAGGTQALPHLLAYLAERRQHRGRWVGALAATAVPLCFINGADDPVSGAHMAQRYREVVPRPHVVLLPGIGHYPQVEDPEAVLGALAEFHARVGVTAA